MALEKRRVNGVGWASGAKAKQNYDLGICPSCYGPLDHFHHEAGRDELLRLERGEWWVTA